MKPIVAVVDTNSFSKAIHLIGGIHELNKPEKTTVVKVGIFNAKSGICTTVKTLNSIIDTFNKTKKILVAESDSFAGPGLERLEVWKDCYNERAIPFNLSNDNDTKEVEIAGETVPFSHVLFEPKSFVSTHVPRRFEETGDEDLMSMGTILKNLLGLILDTKKFRFHEQLSTALLDMYESIGGIDLAVIDGTWTFLGWKKRRTIVSTNVLLVGKDAVAVEAVGAYLVGYDPVERPLLQEARDRGLGKIDIGEIDIVGNIESPRKMVLEAFYKLQS
jgi:uncharacterized protein (DUF362 family)